MSDVLTLNGNVLINNGNALTISGVGPAEVEEKQINFIDYDGTLLYSYTKTEINAMTSESELPRNPSHTGLTAQGWNWTLAQIKAQLTALPDGPVWVGQMYTTTSGATEIDVEFDDANYLSPYLCICPNGTVTIDWGDGSATGELTGTSVSSRKYLQHTYSSVGKYTIKLTTTNKIGFSASSTSYPGILKVSNVEDNTRYNATYAQLIKAVRFGNGASASSGSGFARLYNLETVTIPSNIDGPNYLYFGSDYSLKCVVFPNTATSIYGGACDSTYSLERVSLPATITAIGSSTFSYSKLASITIPSGSTISNTALSYCYSLRSLYLPSSVTSLSDTLTASCKILNNISYSSITSIGNSVFSNLHSMTSVTIPNTVTSMGNYNFYYCYSLKSITIPSSVETIGTYFCSYSYAIEELHMLPTTPPTLGANAFKSIASFFKIYVPSASLTAYQTADGWSDFASYMVGE